MDPDQPSVFQRLQHVLDVAAHLAVLGDDEGDVPGILRLAPGLGSKRRPSRREPLQRALAVEIGLAAGPDRRQSKPMTLA